MSTKYVTIKLVDGSNIITSIINETETEIVIEMPFIVNTFPMIVNGAMEEYTTMKPLMPHSNTRIFNVPRSTIIFCNELHPILIPAYYQLILKFHEEQDAIIKPNGDIEVLDESINEYNGPVINEEYLKNKSILIGNNTLH